MRGEHTYSDSSLGLLNEVIPDLGITRPYVVDDAHRKGRLGEDAFAIEPGDAHAVGCLALHTAVGALGERAAASPDAEGEKKEWVSTSKGS